MAETVQQGAGTAAEVPHKLPVKTLVSASIGNAVEWFDWTVYATFVVFFAGQFFPAENEALALLGRWAASCSAGSPTCAAARPGCCSPSC
jgi:MHS family alpha-ketoglutarate permease-like MFS transporter